MGTFSKQGLVQHSETFGKQRYNSQIVWSVRSSGHTLLVFQYLEVWGSKRKDSALHIQKKGFCFCLFQEVVLSLKCTRIVSFIHFLIRGKIQTKALLFLLSGSFNCLYANLEFYTQKLKVSSSIVRLWKTAMQVTNSVRCVFVRAHLIEGMAMKLLAKIYFVCFSWLF